ncbi:15412_t:CDS:2, partial [Rhizophagus irregularis]
FQINIDPEIWFKSGSNTNYAEAAHFMRKTITCKDLVPITGHDGV